MRGEGATQWEDAQEDDDEEEEDEEGAMSTTGRSSWSAGVLQLQSQQLTDCGADQTQRRAQDLISLQRSDTDARQRASTEYELPANYQQLP
jgi:hypothetical protein